MMMVMLLRGTCFPLHPVRTCWSDVPTEPFPSCLVILKSRRPLVNGLLSAVGPRSGCHSLSLLQRVTALLRGEAAMLKKPVLPVFCFFLIVAEWRWCSLKELLSVTACLVFPCKGAEQLSFGSFSPRKSGFKEFYFQWQGLGLSPAKFSTFLIWFLLEGWLAACLDWIEGVICHTQPRGSCLGVGKLNIPEMAKLWGFFGGGLSRCVSAAQILAPLHFVTSGGM